MAELPICNCYDKQPTVPVFRDQFTHLRDCPCYGMHAMPVGVAVGRVEYPVTLRTSESEETEHG